MEYSLGFVEICENGRKSASFDEHKSPPLHASEPRIVHLLFPLLLYQMWSSGFRFVRINASWCIEVHLGM
ncbi:hypothetical protein Bca101_015319 [Brassica carinata]